MKNKKNGFALIIAVIFMTVMLTLGLAMSSLGYKQELLASTAIQSQYAFYAADAGLECALYADQKRSTADGLQSFFTNPPMGASVCGGSVSTSTFPITFPDQLISSVRINLDEQRCADITVYKPQSGVGRTYIFSQGYDVPCSGTSGARFVSRGIFSYY